MKNGKKIEREWPLYAIKITRFKLTKEVSKIECRLPPYVSKKTSFEVINNDDGEESAWPLCMNENKTFKQTKYDIEIKSKCFLFANKKTIFRLMKDFSKTESGWCLYAKMKKRVEVRKEVNETISG